MTAYTRILLKITGEALRGSASGAYDFNAVEHLARTIADVRATFQLELALVIGGGNIWRGAAQTRNGEMDRVQADYMGMLATVMNALAVQDALLRLNIPCIVQSAIPMEPICARLDRRAAESHLAQKGIVIFAAGTGSPFFTTDTTAALRALETRCQAVLKATKVDGIYSADPVKVPDATRFETLTFDEVLRMNLAVMDASAFSMCRDRKLPIIVFNFNDQTNLSRVLSGDMRCATCVS